MTAARSVSQKAEALAERLGLSYDHLLGFRFAVNVLIASAIVWYTVRVIGDSNPMWALASMVAAADPQPDQASRVFRSRLINVAVGCLVGFAFLTFGSGQQRMVPVALAVTVLISSYLVRVKTMWRQAPITAAVVIAAGLVGGSAKVGMGRGLHKVAEVLFGCVIGILVSLVMSKVWLVRPPGQQDRNA